MAKSLRVLQIEDSDSDAALVVRLLERAGYDLVCERVETGRELQIALNRGVWDIIIADYYLPQFNALSALKNVRATGRDIPFIVVSGAIGEDLAVEMMKLGAHDFVMKSDLSRLVPAIEREVNEARTRDQHRRAEAALRESEREFRNLAESIPQFVWMTKGNGQMMYCNSRCQLELELNPSHAVADQWAKSLHPEDRESCLAAWRQSLSDHTPLERECRFRTRTGGYRWFLCRAIPVTDTRGALSRWFGTYTDIDDQKRTQERLLEINRELERSNSMLEQFAYITSHDLREPLRNVSVYVQLLADECKDSPRASAAEYVRFAREGVLRMSRLVDDLLALSRAGRNDQPLVTVDVGRVLDEALANLSVTLEETCARVIRGPLPNVTADFGQLVQLFQNLLANALKYRKEDTSPVIAISAERQGSEWVFAVQDNGIGMNPDYFEQIFRVFKRLHTQDKYDGTGIGLSICQKIVERHKGRIWVQSAEGEGSTFYFSIPDAH